MSVFFIRPGIFCWREKNCNAVKCKVQRLLFALEPKGFWSLDPLIPLEIPANVASLPCSLILKMDFLKHLKHFLKQRGSGRGAQRLQRGTVPEPLSGAVVGLLLALEVPLAPLLGKQQPGCCSSVVDMLYMPCMFCKLRVLRVLRVLALRPLHAQRLHRGFPRPSLAPGPAFG